MSSPVFRTRNIPREEIPRFEQVLGLAILLFIAALGVGLFLKGKHYDPHRFALNPEALESTRAEVTGKAATLRADDMRNFEMAGRESPAAAATGTPARVLPAMADGFSPMGPTEHYRPDSLFEKINGRAPAYLDFNFQELTVRSFTVDAAPGEFVDVFIFSMDTPLNAFGIFSLEREDNAQAVDFVTDGYRSEMGYFFRQGKAYIQVLASSANAEVMGPAEQFARALAASIPADDTGLGAMSLLPEWNRVPDSVNYLQSDAYGLSLFKDVYEARYDLGGSLLSFFAMQTATETEAQAAWEQALDFNRNYAEVTGESELDGARYFVAENFGEWNVLFQRGTNVGGVVNAPEAGLARQFVEAFLRGESLDVAPAAATKTETPSDAQPAAPDYGGGYDE